ncbi:MAG: amidohydrolase family protein [Bacteroidota bacterium]
MKTLFRILILIPLQLASQNRTVIQNVRLFDGTKAHEQTNIEIENGSIVSISDRKTSTADAVVIDGRGMTVLPGLINAHTHVWDASQLKQALRAGVFGLLDMHSPEEYTAPLRDLKLSDGYANFFSAGHAATVEGGHGTQYGFEVPTIGEDLSPEEFVKQRKEHGSDYIKIIYEPSKSTLTLDEIKELISSANAESLLAVAHISTLANAMELVSLNIDAFVHVWRDEIISKEQVSKLVDNRVFVIPTLAVHEKVQEYYQKKRIKSKRLSIDRIGQNVRLLYESGVPILSGTDAPNLGIDYGPSIYRELELLVESGLPEIEALKSATSNIAHHFNLKDLGNIREGQAANFLIVNGNPLENISDIRSIQSIWIDGKPRSNN